MRAIRILMLLLCAAILAGCSPRFNWHSVVFGEQGASGVLPDAAHVQTKTVQFGSIPLPLTMHSAHAGGVLFGLGEAPLPASLSGDPQARERLDRWAVASFYRTAGVPVPATLPAPGERFVIEGHGPKGRLRFEIQIMVTNTEWLEAIVVATPHDFDRAPVDDFWLALRWSAAAPAGSAATQQ
ncbi:MAG TPA: hypothetical protein VF285_01585 [Castellaniella sp.]|uniref:hypothetical protein n=1 Tax=Castellaniella sp. TaxID=1955812 RepID=UPI002F0BE6AA